MNRLRAVRPIWWVTLGLSLLVLSASFGVRMVRREVKLWRRAADSAGELEYLVREAERKQELLEKRIPGPAIDPGALFRNTRPDIKAEVEIVEVRELPRGYRHRVARVIVEEADWDRLRVCLRKLERGVPPWRLTEALLETTPDGLRGRLRLEALDKPATDL